jgi:glycosyltransferase involved in cell wall biosynthesis
MTATPTLSVVIPAYNNGRTLAETMDSVLSQEGVDFELIVADHSSTDDTRNVMARYADDPRVTLLDTEAGGGAGRNWNRVSAEARGEYIKLVCGDDVLRPGTLARQVEILRDSGAVLTACRRDIVDAEGKVLMAGWGLRGLREPVSGATAVRKAVRAGSNLFGEPASVTMRRSIFAEAGGWFDRFPYLIDQASYSRVLLRGAFAPDLEVGATFRMSSAQWSVALTRDQASQARGFHAWLRAQHPRVISRADQMVGDLRATLMAHARRLSYRVLERRMR